MQESGNWLLVPTRNNALMMTSVFMFSQLSTGVLQPTAKLKLYPVGTGVLSLVFNQNEKVCSADCRQDAGGNRDQAVTCKVVTVNVTLKCRTFTKIFTGVSSHKKTFSLGFQIFAEVCLSPAQYFESAGNF